MEEAQTSPVREEDLRLRIVWGVENLGGTSLIPSPDNWKTWSEEEKEIFLKEFVIDEIQGENNLELSIHVEELN